MKQPFTLLLLPVIMFTAGWLRAQEDSIKIQQINVHIIKNGKQTPDYFTRNQKTLTMDERLIREINFDDSTRQIKNYTFYFYRDGKLFTEETYDKSDMLQFIIKHAYNIRGQEEEVARLILTNGQPVQTEKSEFIYDNGGNILVKKDFKTGKKPYRVTTYIYSSGHLIKEHSKARKSPDQIVLSIVDYLYAADGKLKTKSILEKTSDKAIKKITETYMYNDKGKLEKTEIRDKDGEISLVRNYVYYPEGGLYRYYEQTREGDMLCYQTYAYKKHRINLGEQKSYYDKP